MRGLDGSSGDSDEACRVWRFKWGSLENPMELWRLNWALDVLGACGKRGEGAGLDFKRLR